MNLLKEKIRRGEPVVGTVCQLGGGTSVECLGLAGMDFAVIDTEHGPFSHQDAMDWCRAAEVGGTTAVVRVPDYTRPSLHRMINCGAKGLVIPCMETMDEVKLLVEQARLFPQGKHCFPYGRNSGWGQQSAGRLTQFYQEANDDLLLIPQCETVGFLSIIEEVVQMKEIDGIFFGPYDLTADMGIAGQFQHPDYLAARRRVLDACKASGKPAISFSPDVAAARQNLTDGFAGVCISIDAVEFIKLFQSIAAAVKAP